MKKQELQQLFKNEILPEMKILIIFKNLKEPPLQLKHIIPCVEINTPFILT